MSLWIGTDWKISRAVEYKYLQTRHLDWLMNQIDHCVFDDMCVEEKWYKVFANHIQPNHQLVELLVELNGWHRPFHFSESRPSGPKIVMVSPEDEAIIHKWRQRLLIFFDDYVRGIRKPKIICTNTTKKWLSPYQIQAIEMAMTRNKRTAKERISKQNRSLAAALLAAKLWEQDQEV